MTVAHLAATYGTNGMPVDADKPWSVDLIDVAAIVAQATAARTAGADLVVASIHCCVEYRTEPTPEQVTITQRLADSGVVDLVIGHHAHVPQPVEHAWTAAPTARACGWRTASATTCRTRTASAARPRRPPGCCSRRTSKPPGRSRPQGRAAGPARVTGVEWTPITVDRRGGHQVHALVDIAGGTGTLSPAQVAERTAAVVAAAGDQAPQRTVPLSPTGPAPVVVPRVSG